MAISIIFVEEDNQGVQFLHNDVVVVILKIENHDVRHILIDNGSLANVLYYDALLKMGMSPDQLS